LGELTTPFPDVDRVQLSTGGPTGHVPVPQGFAGESVTLAGALVVHEIEIDPDDEPGPVTTTEKFDPPPRAGLPRLTWIVLAGPVDRKKRARMSPAPRTATTPPIATRPVRTGGGRGRLPIDLRGETALRGRL
jgi:hypothetical protein